MAADREMVEVLVFAVFEAEEFMKLLTEKGGHMSLRPEGLALRDTTGIELTFEPYPAQALHRTGYRIRSDSTTTDSYSLTSVVAPAFAAFASRISPLGNRTRISTSVRVPIPM